MSRKTDMDYLHDLLIRIDDRLDDMGETLVRHDENLAQHMRRSEAVEEQLEVVKKHVNMVQGVGAFLGIVAIIATIWAAVK